MRKVLAMLLAALTVAAALAGCGKVPDEKSSGVSEASSGASGVSGSSAEAGPTFYLPELPEIGPYQKEKAPERWYPDYTDTVIPRADYGRLLPYAGGVFLGVGFDEVYPLAFYRWGLCDESGKLVTDAVFDEITYRDGCYLLTRRLDTKAVDYLAVSEDGSKVFHPTADKYCTLFLAGEDTVLLQNDEKHLVQFYTVDGRLKGTLKGDYYYSGHGPDSESILFYSYYSFGEEYVHVITDTPILTDMSGNVICDDLPSINDIAGKYLITRDDTGNTYGICDATGKVLLEGYDRINYDVDGSFFLLHKGRKLTLLDGDFKKIGGFICPDTGGEYLSATLYGDKVISVWDGENTYPYTLTGEALPYVSMNAVYDYNYRFAGYYTAIEKSGDFLLLDRDLRELRRFNDGDSTYIFLQDGMLLESIPAGFRVIDPENPENDKTFENAYYQGEGIYQKLNDDGSWGDEYNYRRVDDPDYRLSTDYGILRSCLAEIKVYSVDGVIYTMRNMKEPLVTVRQYLD